MTDYDNFRLYLKQCSDRQVYGVWERERQADRNDYASLAVAELERRGLDLYGMH